MLTGYLLVKFVHILAAIVGFGFTLTYGPLIMRARTNAAAMPFTLEAVLALSKASTWAFTLAIVTGLAMGHLGKLQVTAFWFLASLVIAVVAMAIAGAMATPTLKRQIALVGQGGAATAELESLGARSMKIGLVLHALALTLIGLMVFKPTL